MSHFLRISITFLDRRFHGRSDGGQPEWPPSPLRVFQALVAAAAQHWNERSELVQAAPPLRWLESLPNPEIVAGPAIPCQHPYRLYVPDNVGDKVAGSWSRGREASIAEHRTEKDVRPVYLSEDTIHLLYPVKGNRAETSDHIEHLIAAARSITHLGWGIDMVAANAAVIDHEEAEKLSGHRWLPTIDGGTSLRVPINGTLSDLMRKHADFLNRLDQDGFRPVPPLTKFELQSYRRDNDPVQRPYRVFELRRTDGSRFRYPHRRFIHIAGMLRHLAIEAMKASPPSDVDDDWVESFVAGHVQEGKTDHRQLSYLPLPSLGHLHTDPGVRRVMLAASPGEKALLDYIARRLAGQILRPEHGDEFTQRDWQDPPMLVPVAKDNIAVYYTQPSARWQSFTPVILPGHDDHKPHKTRQLIERALVQSGVRQPCTFEWSSYSGFPKSFSAHKYDRDKKQIGYVRPNHLLSQTAVHISLEFKDGLKVPGPLVIGAGRHCGFGLMAPPLAT